MAKAKSLSVEDLDALEEKTEARDPDAQTMLALAYHAGVLLKRDDAEALRLLHRAADRGSMAAEESLGIFSEGGIGMERPAPADALNWYDESGATRVNGRRDRILHCCMQMERVSREIPRRP